jgi:hypothetical protein
VSWQVVVVVMVKIESFLVVTSRAVEKNEVNQEIRRLFVRLENESESFCFFLSRAVRLV